MLLNGLVQLLPGASHYEDAHQERDDQLDQEDQPARQHVLRVGQHLLHAAKGRADVDVECLGGEETNDAGNDVPMHGQRGHWEDGVLETKRHRGESRQDNNLECLGPRDDGVERADELGGCETGLDVSGQDILRENSSLSITLLAVVYLAENMSQSYAHCGGEDGDSHSIDQSVEVATGQVYHNVTPYQGEAD